MPLSTRRQRQTCFVRVGLLLKDSEEGPKEVRISSRLVAVSKVEFGKAIINCYEIRVT